MRLPLMALVLLFVCVSSPATAAPVLVDIFDNGSFAPVPAGGWGVAGGWVQEDFTIATQVFLEEIVWTEHDLPNFEYHSTTLALYRGNTYSAEPLVGTDADVVYATVMRAQRTPNDSGSLDGWSEEYSQGYTYTLNGYVGTGLHVLLDPGTYSLRITHDRFGTSGGDAVWDPTAGTAQTIDGIIGSVGASGQPGRASMGVNLAFKLRGVPIESVPEAPTLFLLGSAALVGWCVQHVRVTRQP